MMSKDNIPLAILKYIILNLQLWAFFQGTQERVPNSRGKQAINVRANEGLLYELTVLMTTTKAKTSLHRHAVCSESLSAFTI